MASPHTMSFARSSRKSKTRLSSYVGFFLNRVFLMFTRSYSATNSLFYLQRELELNSPHLTEHDAELWLEFIKRDIPFWKDITLPAKPDYNVYCSLRKQVANEVDEDAERMRKALRGLDKEKGKRSSKFVDPDKMGLPKEKPTAAQKFAAYDRMVGGVEPVFVLNTPKEGSKGLTPYDDCSRWKLGTPKLPQKAPPPRKSALPAAVKRNERLSIPTHRLGGMASKVAKAPQSLVEDYKTERHAADNRPAPRNNNVPSTKPGAPTSQQKATIPSAASISRENVYPNSRQPQGPSHAKAPSQVAKPNVMTPTSKASATSDKIRPSNITSRPASASSASSNPRAHRPTPSPAGNTNAQGDSSSSQTAAKRPVPRPTATKRPADNPLFTKPKKPRVS